MIFENHEIWGYFIRPISKIDIFFQENITLLLVIMCNTPFKCTCGPLLVRLASNYLGEMYKQHDAKEAEWKAAKDTAAALYGIFLDDQNEVSEMSAAVAASGEQEAYQQYLNAKKEMEEASEAVKLAMRAVALSD